jgi:hypothetical protein
VLLAPCRADAAGQRRFGVIVGANRGEPGEVGLLYAERDASRMADVLTRFAGVDAEDMVLLRGAKVADVERVLTKLKARIVEAKAAGEESLVFLYYSGHADAQALHLAHERLEFKRATELLDATGAQLRIMVVDACRSGELTRIKGAVPAKPFEIIADDRLSSEGTAVITSSAAGEDAQESDRLRGGVFTHHFVTGLLGAADASGDQRVTLSEAYRYAYLETLRTTSRARFVQHPTYSFKISGREDLVLTRLTSTSGLGRLVLDAPGTYVLLPAGSGGGSVAELTATAGVRVLLEPGEYVVRRRTETAVFEGRATVTSKTEFRVRARDLRRVPYGASVRKGYAPQRRIWGVTSSVGASGAWQTGLSPHLQGAVGVRADIAAASFELRLRYDRSSGANDSVELTQNGFGLDLGVLKLFDLPGLTSAFGFGLRFGADVVLQTLASDGDAPDRSALVGRTSPFLRWEWAVLPDASVALEAGADLVLTPGEQQLQATPGGALSLTVYLW